MNRDLEGKIILVTGCGGGIGSSICAAVHARGGTLIGADLGQAGASVVRELGATYIALDVTDEGAWQAAREEVGARFGALHGLVNSAGIILMKPLLDTTIDEYRRVNQVNNEGVFLGMRTFAGLLGETPSAHGNAIVNFSSIYGLGGQPNYAAYCASKGAVRLATKAAALEFAAMRVRVNSVHPGPIDTPLAREPLEALVAAGRLASVAQGLARVGAASPSGRIGTPEDVCGVVCFLLSDDARFVSGAELAIDAGMSARA